MLEGKIAEGTDEYFSHGHLLVGPSTVSKWSRHGEKVKMRYKEYVSLVP
jgi:hypothetical protein